jgi:hypothetical protein
MTTPPLRALQRNGTHRLIPSRYSEQGTVLAEVCDNDAMLADVALLDGATNDRIQGEHRGLPGISPYELVYGIPNAHIVNAAFTHTNQAGGRFNTGIRGAWYAALEQKTSLAEVVYHKARRLAGIVVPEVPELPGQRPDREVSTCDDWLADFHALDPAVSYAKCLQPQPVPQRYAASQQFADSLLHQGAHGPVYPSVRRSAGHCLVCFRPALVYNPRRGDRLRIEFTAIADGYRHTVTLIAK